MASAVSQREAERLSVSSSVKAGDLSDDKMVEKDIDGLPLRDHKKIDLKLILGHAPEVDDDEDESGSNSQSQATLKGGPTLPGLTDDLDEYEYGYSDDGNEEGEEDEEEENAKGNATCRRPLKRRSSLKTVRHPDFVDSDESPAHKKAVRFADALGLGLAAVRDLINADEPPEIPHSALKDLRIRKRKSKLSGDFHLALNFIQPSADPEFMLRLPQQKVMLENCVASDRDLAVSGVIRVMNISFEKRVNIRYTIDSWQHFKDLPTTYVPNSNDGVTDRFMFILHLPVGFGMNRGGLNRLEFAIQFLAGVEEYWDNNKGSNYGVDCTLVPISPRQGPARKESSGSEGEFVI